MTTGRDAAHPAASARMTRKRAPGRENRSAKAEPVAMLGRVTTTGEADALPNAPARRIVLTAGKRTAVINVANEEGADLRANSDPNADQRAIVDQPDQVSVHVPKAAGPPGRPAADL